MSRGVGHGSGPRSRAVCPRVPDAQHWAGRSGGEGPGAGALLAAPGCTQHRSPHVPAAGAGAEPGCGCSRSAPSCPSPEGRDPTHGGEGVPETPSHTDGARTPQPENHSLRPRFQPWPERPANAPREASMGGSPTARQGAPQEPRAERPAGPHEQAATALPTLCGLGRGRGATCARPSARTRLHEARHPMLRMPPFETAETSGAAGRRRHGGHGAPPSCAPPSQSLCAWDPHFLCSLQLAGPPGTGLRPAPVGAAPNRECWAQGRAAGQRSSRRGRAGRVLGHTARCPHGMSPALPWKPELDP